MTWRINQVQPYIDGNELEAIADVIGSGWLTEGRHARGFQAAIKQQTGARHAVLAPNGTLGLFLALLALDLPRGSEILIPSFTFCASASSAVFAGLRPVFVDADPATFNIDISALESLVGENTRAIMPVGIYGQSPPMDRIVAFAAGHGLAVVEDAAQLYGVNYLGRHAGTWGDVGVISFFADKSVTTGEGGVVLTDDEALHHRLRLLRNQGRENSGTFVHQSLGLNFRVTDMQCAVGEAQLRKLPKIIARKQLNHGRYVDNLSGVDGIRMMKVQEGSDHVPFRFAMLTERRSEVVKALETAGIQTRGFFYPLHLQPALRQYARHSLPVAEELHSKGICLPVHLELTDSDIDEICEVIRATHEA